MEYLPTDLPKYVKQTSRSALANSVVESGHVLLFSEDGESLTAKLPDGSFVDVGGGGSDTSDATATAGDILSGKTAYADGQKLTGTIQSKAAATYTPTTSDQVIASGQYLAGAQTVKGDANLIAANIKDGVSIFGVTGTSGSATDFYKCASIDTVNHTWTGYKAVLSGGVYTFESTATTGLTYSAGFVPEIGKVYGDDALILASLYTGSLPLDGLLCSALPDPAWTSGQTVARWGDFMQPDSSKRPQIATIGGITGIKAINGSEMIAAIGSAITGDFTYAVKFYISGNYSVPFLNDNTWNGAVAGLNATEFILSKQGVSSVDVPLSLSVGVHTAVVTYQTNGSSVFYIDGVTVGSESYSPDFVHSAAIYHSHVATSDNLILGLAAYNRALSAAEIANVSW